MKKITFKTKKLFTIFAAAFVMFAAAGAWAFSFRNMTLDFIHISDTHITQDRMDTSYKALSSSSELLKDAIAQINEIKGLDFVLFTGDMVDSATSSNYRQYYTLLTRLNYPSLNAFGNHDLSYGELSKEEVLEIVKKCNPNYRFDDTYYAFSPKSDFRIIVLDAVSPDITTSNGKISDKQLEFLDKELSQNQDKIVIVAMHHPAIEPFISTEHALLNSDALNEILVKYKNPIIVLSGHYHAAKIRRIGNIVYVSTPAMVTYPMAFRHIKITNYKDRVNFDFKLITTNLEDVKEQNRQSVISYSALAGLEKDRNTSFIYNKRHPGSIDSKRNKIKNANTITKTTKKDIKNLSKIKRPKKEEPEYAKPNPFEKLKEKLKFNKKNKELKEAS